MAYFEVTNAPEDAIDGVDVARTKSIGMVPWQEALTKSLQKAQAGASPSNLAADGTGHHGRAANFVGAGESDNNIAGNTTILVPQDSGTKSSGKTFAPETALVGVGDTITWTNNDPVPHTVDSADGNSISSGYIMKDQSFQHTFTQAGTYEYYCTLHPRMTGTIKVAEKAA